MQQVVTPSRRHWANRDVTREVDRERARWWWGAFGAMLLAAAPFAAYLLEQNECVRLSYEASALREQREALIERERRLKMERARLADFGEIEAWALKRHGMVRPEPEQRVVVSALERDPAASATPTAAAGSGAPGSPDGRSGWKAP